MDIEKLSNWKLRRLIKTQKVMLLNCTSPEERNSLKNELKDLIDRLKEIEGKR